MASPEELECELSSVTHQLNTAVTQLATKKVTMSPFTLLQLHCLRMMTVVGHLSVPPRLLPHAVEPLDSQVSEIA